MFSSNDTPAEEFVLADKLNAIINLDDITHIDFLEKAIGHIPETISCRYNPGGMFKISNDIMDNPGDAKYGMTTEQLFEAFKILKAKGAKEFGIHAFLASNTYTTGQVDELDVYTCFLLKFYRNFKQYFRKHRIIFICYGITCKECMDTKFFCSFCFQNFESFK